MYFQAGIVSCLLATSAVAQKACSALRNGGFELTQGAQNHMSPHWTVGSNGNDSVTFLSNGVNPGESTPYGKKFLQFQPSFCDVQSASQSLCLAKGASYKVSYAYNFYSINYDENRVEQLDLDVYYGSKLIDQVQITGNATNTWVERTAPTFTTTTKQGALKFTWGTVPLSCPDSGVISSTMLLDNIKVVKVIA